MNKNFDKWDKKIKCSLPAWYVFNCCMEHVKYFVSDPEELEQWEEVLEFLIDNDYFWEFDACFDEVMEGFIKYDIRFIDVDDLSKKGLEYYAKINKWDNVDLIERHGDYDLDDDNYITTLKNNTIAIWSF